MRPRIGVILAAGQGVRMRSELPKVLHPVAGRPMLHWVVEAVRGAGCDRVLVVVGHGAERVRSAFPDSDLEWIEQTERRGTGHALAQAGPRVSGEATVLVASGDVPLVRATTLEALSAAADAAWGALAVARAESPGDLGRVFDDGSGGLSRIVEAADASEREREVDLINAGLYALPAPDVFSRLARLRPHGSAGELYLTDAVSEAAAEGLRVSLVRIEDPSEALGVNDRRGLAAAHRAMLWRVTSRLMDAGVTVLDPERTVVEPAVRVGPDAVLHPGVCLLGSTEVGRGAVLQQGVWARDTRIAPGAVIEPYSVLDGAVVGEDCRVGPFARLRPGALLGRGSRVGNFVEVKNSRLGEGVKAPHLAYLGDATVGDGANIGAGAVTCNYDGISKHPTEIGRGAFIGSDTMLVAPVKVGDGATTAAGSVIVKDVPAGSLAVERGRQRTVADWRKRRRRREEE